MKIGLKTLQRKFAVSVSIGGALSVTSNSTAEKFRDILAPVPQETCLSTFTFKLLENVAKTNPQV